MSETEFLIGLDFLGAGNLGDDLMVSGFLDGIRRLGLAGKMRRLRAICSYDRSSQRHRFPQIEWIDGRPAAARQMAIKNAGVLLGVGGTAFQMTVGDWLLKNLEELVAVKSANAPLILVNSGSETEAAREKVRFQTVMKEISTISTRDTDTFALLEEWRNGGSQPQLVHGADLANITLPDLCKDHPPIGERPHELGIILGSDTLSRQDVDTVIRWINREKQPVSWITCEVRNLKGGEYREYRRNRHRLGGVISQLWRPRVRLSRPKYHTCSLTDLVEPFAQCKTVLSSRYHGLLSAAWSGCRVGGIARSSKVKWLCEQLGVPTLDLPITAEGLSEIRKSADVVKRSTLEQFKDAALQGVDGLGLSEC